MTAPDPAELVLAHLTVDGGLSTTGPAVCLSGRAADNPTRALLTPHEAVNLAVGLIASAEYAIVVDALRDAMPAVLGDQVTPEVFDRVTAIMRDRLIGTSKPAPGTSAPTADPTPPT